MYVPYPAQQSQTVVKVNSGQSGMLSKLIVTVLAVLCPYAFIFISITPTLDSVTMVFIILPSPHIRSLVLPYVSALSVFHIVVPLPHVHTLVRKHFLSPTKQVNKSQ